MGTHVAAHDQGFVDAPVSAVYMALRDVPSYVEWWPDAAGPSTLDLGRLRGLRVAADRFREDLGLFLSLEGRGTGTLEWHLEPFEGGTIVNAILNLDLSGGPRRSARGLLGARMSVRRGLVELKHRLERNGR